MQITGDLNDEYLIMISPMKLLETGVSLAWSHYAGHTYCACYNARLFTRWTTAVFIPETNNIIRLDELSRLMFNTSSINVGGTSQDDIIHQDELSISRINTAKAMGSSWVFKKSGAGSQEGSHMVT